MLVLSRKEDQKVIIPGLDICIKVVRCKNSSVTLGFDAPAEIRIMRDEVEEDVAFNDSKLRKFMEEKVSALPLQRRHDVRDQLNVVTLAMQMLSDDISSGRLDSVDEVFDRVCQSLRNLKPSQDDTEAIALVVEDEANERELLAGILRMNGYRVATASDGNEALKYINENDPPAFIVVDMHMPGCDGVELVRRIRELPHLNHVRVYVVSGLKEEECQLAANSIDGWYTKPLAPSDLISAMAGCV